MPTETNDSECIGKYIVHSGRLIKSNGAKMVPEEAKTNFFKLLETSVTPRQTKKVVKEVKEVDVQAVVTDKSIASSVKKTTSSIECTIPKQSAALATILQVVQNSKHPGVANTTVSTEGHSTISTAVRLILREVIESAKKTANHGNRKRVIPDDIDMAVGMLKINHASAYPVLTSTPRTDRLYWGRKLVTPGKLFCPRSTELVTTEKFCETIVIRDHWLAVEGVQPCVPENVVPMEVKEKTQQEQEETQRQVGFSLSGIRKERSFERRMAKQFFSLDHQVLFSRTIEVLTTGSPLERKQVMECLANDTGLQFLAGRFVIHIAEGVRVNVGCKNIRQLANLIKLTYGLMKNPKIRLEKYLYVLVPAIMTCIINKCFIPLVEKIGTRGKAIATNDGPESSQEDEERIIRDIDLEIRLREASSRVLAELSNQYPSQCLSVRVIQILKRVLQGNYDLASVYGALCTFYAFGYLTIKTILIPHLHELFTVINSSQNQTIPVKSSMTKRIKIAIEAENKRTEIMRNKVIELIMKILFEYETANNESRAVDQDEFIKSYAEFGTMFYSYVIETGRIDDNGNVHITRPSLLTMKNPVTVEEEKTAKSVKQTQINATYGQPSVKQEILDVDMLDNLLDDDVDRPWKEVAKKLEEKEKKGDTNESTRTVRSSFLGKSHLFVVRKNKVANSTEVPTVSYIRPLELGHLPTAPFYRFTKKDRIGGLRSSFSQSVGSFRVSRTGKSIDDLAMALGASKESSETMKRYLSRPPEQAAAIIYGRELETSERERSSLDRMISDAAASLSNVRLRNALSNQRSSMKRDEMNRGKFLAPTIDRGNRL